jgi:vancomycin permeability regulator SanA
LKFLKQSKRFITVFIVLVVGFLASIFGTGEILSQHARQDIGAAPVDLPFESVRFDSADQQSVSG